MIALGANVYYSPSFLNTGASGTYASGTAKFTLPENFMPNGITMYVSGEAGYYWLGTTNFVLRRLCRQRGDRRLESSGLRILERRHRVHLEGLHPRSALSDTNLSTRRTATPSPAIRATRTINVVVEQLHDRLRLQMVRRGVHRQAVGRPDARQPEVSLQSALIGRRPFMAAAFFFLPPGPLRTPARGSLLHDIAVALANECEPAAVERGKRRAVADRHDGRLRQAADRGVDRAPLRSARRARRWPRRGTG